MTLIYMLCDLKFHVLVKFSTKTTLDASSLPMNKIWFHIAVYPNIPHVTRNIFDETIVIKENILL